MHRYTPPPSQKSPPRPPQIKNPNATSDADPQEIDELFLSFAGEQKFTFTVYENQRYQPGAGGWGSRYPGHLLPTDRSKYAGGGWGGGRHHSVTASSDSSS